MFYFLKGLYRMSEGIEELESVLEGKLTELRSLKSEMEDLIKEINAPAPQEISNLEEELGELSEECKRLGLEHEDLPNNCRYEICEKMNGRHHWTHNEPFGSPMTEQEKRDGRVRVLKSNERICYPTPFEKDTDCGIQTRVVARISYSLDKSPESSSVSKRIAED
jgi:chromosome segregation ATPase